MAQQQQTPRPLRIDFVSDVSCPWCAIGLLALEQALARIDPVIPFELHFQPFELNPQMPGGGQNATEHLMQKYRISPQQVDRNRAAIQARAAEFGFDFRMDRNSRVYNTFDAHRLLHWAGEQDAGDGFPAAGSQSLALALKHRLLRAYFSQGADVGDHATLIRLAAEAGLDPERAAEMLASGEYAADVRAQQQFYASQGITAVPSVILDRRHLIQGGQPPEIFEQALRQVSGVVSTQTVAA